MEASRWNKVVLGCMVGILAVTAAAVAIIDPFLHYHLPLEGMQYPLLDERYQNDGIARHYSYNAIITGTSMTQNFKPSEFDALWGAEAIKIAFSGASYKEVNDNVRRAMEYNGHVRYVLRSLDGNKLICPADYDEYEGYPDYFYDSNPFNDVSYLLNKEVIPKVLAVINYTRAGNVTPDRDAYGSWSRYKTFGKEQVLQTCPVLEGYEEEYHLSQEDYENIRENVRKNVLQTALDYPETTFYLFFPPYSICYWDALVQTRQLSAQLEAEKIAVQMLLEAPNIHIFAFGEQVELVADLDNYTDSLHYGEWVNSDILRWIHEGKNELNRDNYEAYFERIERLYAEYDYSWLHN